MAKKEITVQFKLQAPGGTATPAPPIGPALGQHGVNPGQFIQQFNAATAALKGKVVGVVVTVYKDRTFSFEVKSPPASVRLKDAVKAEKGSGEPNKNKIGKLTMACNGDSATRLWLRKRRVRAFEQPRHQLHHPLFCLHGA